VQFTASHVETRVQLQQPEGFMVGMMQLQTVNLLDNNDKLI